MESFWQLINDREIQLLVLLSFILQVFLFFTGGLRPRSTDPLLRGTIWIAYLGADVVAIFALGFLSRYEGATNGKNHPLVFFWAPCLLVHLGGQDTITAFAMEDNNLWLRHMLNMVVQVTLALYVFWKSASWRSVRLLVPGIFLFIAGIIKYGERTMALMYGDVNKVIFESDIYSRRRQIIPSVGIEDGYDGCICLALRMALQTRDLLAGHSIQMENFTETMSIVWSMLEGNRVRTRRALPFPTFIEGPYTRLNPNQLFTVSDVELRIMYYDMYTKARSLRTWIGIVLRLISQVSTVVALVLFAVSSKAGYGTGDIVITYTLLIGGLLLEGCAVLTTFIASPWTWAWLEARGHRCLARLSRSLLGTFGWQEGSKPLWSNTMGQYSLLSYMGYGDEESLLQRVMSKIRKIMARSCLGPEVTRRKLFIWVSRLLDTEHQAVDDNMITACLVPEIQHIIDGGQQRQWRHLRLLLRDAQSLSKDFVSYIAFLHLMTEVLLSEAPPSVASSASGDNAALAGICRKLSNYMFYLVAAHPARASLLKVSSGIPDIALELFNRYFLSQLSMPSGGVKKDFILRAARERCVEMIPGFNLTDEQFKETLLEELRNTWVRLLLYAAGKSRPAAHAAQLARGGELLTFAWLLMARYDLGDSFLKRLELMPPLNANERDVGVVYAFNIKPASPPSSSC